MDWEQFWQTVQGWLLDTGVKIVVSLLFIFITFKIINAVAKKAVKKAEKASPEKKVDKTLVRTLSHVIKIALKVVILVCVIGYLGIDTSGITALIASLGVCIGLAVNGALSNFAGGVLLLITRPFKDDDYIDACGYEGTVEDIHMCNTKLRTVDNKVVFIPNGTLSTSCIINYSLKDIRRVDIDFSVSYSDDFEKAKKIIEDIYTRHELVLKDPEPFVRMSAHADSSIVITTRVWTKNSDYWTVKFDLLESVKKAFDENGIEIPFNQLDVHVKNN